MSSFEHATFGNRGGSHQLLGTSLDADNPVLADIRFLVDRPAGHIGPEVVWSPYWGCGPLRNWWVVWRGEEDQAAPRKNMVRARVALLPSSQCGAQESLATLLDFLSGDTPIDEDVAVGAVVDALAHGQLPVVVPGLASAPALLQGLWPRLWPKARKSFSLRTLFGSDSFESSGTPDIVVIPEELRPRWRSPTVITSGLRLTTPAALWFDGDVAPEFERLLGANQDRLPGDFSVLERLERIVDKIKVLQSGQGTPADALLIVRTVEAFEGGLELPAEDIALLSQQLCQLEEATPSDIRAASLTKLTVLGKPLQEITSEVSQWIRKKLPTQSDSDSLWILEQQTRATHAGWWRTAVRGGLASAFVSLTTQWAEALWRWWNTNAQAVSWIEDLVPSDSAIETTLLATIPNQISDSLLEKLADLCKKHRWAKLLAKALHGSRPLRQAVEYLRRVIFEPEAGLDVLLEGQRAAEIVETAAAINWQPLSERAISQTLNDPSLFSEIRILDAGCRRLLAGHLKEGGVSPSICRDKAFAAIIFDSVVAGDENSSQIVLHLAADLAGSALAYPDQDALWDALTADSQSSLAASAGQAWLQAFVAGKEDRRPNTSLIEAVRNGARSAFKDREFERVLSFLTLFPEVSESDVVDWLTQDGYKWREGDDERLGNLLLTCEWKTAARRFRWSWKAELRSAAWYALDLFPWWEQPFVPHPDKSLLPSLPPSATGSEAVNTTKEGRVKSIDVGIITMKEEEYEALLEKFDPSETFAGANRDYDVTAIETPQGECRIAITRCAQQGNAHAQNATTELLSDLKPAFVLVVGIAGGIPSPDFCLGDVVVSDYIQDLTLEDTGVAPGARRFNALGGPLHPTASRIVERLRAIERAGSSWSDSDAIMVQRPGLEGQHTTDDEAWNTDISEALARHGERFAPIATAKKIASSDRLIKDPELLKTWRTVLKAVSAVEMESAGVYIPCQRNNVPVLAIRGISDIVGWKRDEAWTLYACHTAAAYTRMLIRAGVFCPKNLLATRGSS